MNPYQPNQPVTPESFAGRADLIAKLEESIEAARSPMHRTTAFLLHGYRGSGKTSAIRKIRAVLTARVPNLVGIEVQLLGASGDEQLLGLFLDNLRAQPGPPTPFWKRAKELLSRITTVTTPVGGIELMPTQPGTPRTSQALWNECLRAFEGAPLIFIAVDDADYLTDEGLGFLKTVAESHSKVPLLLAVAGGPPLLDKMAKAHLSPVARIFSGARFDIGELTREETHAAIDAPPRFAKVRVTWTDEAKDRIFDYSRGSAYLVQCLAYAAFREGATIQAPAVDESLPRALQAGEDWLSRAIPEASKEDIRCFLEIVSSGQPRLSSSEILNLGVAPTYIQRLVRLRVLRRISRGQYELAMAPVIAYYHALRRGLRKRP